MAGRLEGKRILITAAGQGMGRAAALACAAEGARVLATDRDAGLLADLAAQGIETTALDVTDAGAVRAVVGGAGDLDGLFNCAGIVVNGALADTDEAEWHQSFDVNIHAMFHVTRAALPGLLRRAGATGAASVVNMASMASSVKGFANRCA